MMAAGALSRFYWSNSPPQIWVGEEWFIEALSKIDVHISPVIWGILAFCAPYVKREVELNNFLYLGWFCLIQIAILI